MDTFHLVAGTGNKILPIDIEDANGDGIDVSGWLSTGLYLTLRNINDESDFLLDHMPLVARSASDDPPGYSGTASVGDGSDGHVMHKFTAAEAASKTLNGETFLYKPIISYKDTVIEVDQTEATSWIVALEPHVGSTP